MFNIVMFLNTQHSLFTKVLKFYTQLLLLTTLKHTTFLVIAVVI